MTKEKEREKERERELLGREEKIRGRVRRGQAVVVHHLDDVLN